MHLMGEGVKKSDTFSAEMTSKRENADLAKEVGEYRRGLHWLEKAGSFGGGFHGGDNGEIEELVNGGSERRKRVGLNGHKRGTIGEYAENGLGGLDEKIELDAGER